jgi:quercetin 2,3-dioxygenase
MEQGRAKIYLHEERGLGQADWFRSFYTFNFGNYFNQHRHPFGRLYVLNEETVAGGRTMKMQVEEDSFVMLLPVTGAIKITDPKGQRQMIHPGRVQAFHALKNDSFEIGSPSSNELVNFLQIWLKLKPGDGLVNKNVLDFDLDSNKNQMVYFLPAPEYDSIPACVCAIGKFAGRADMVYQLRNENAGVFVYVIEGAFEVQNRLLHANDGLALWDAAAIEAEALSNDAILLVIEQPLEVVGI